MHYGVKRESHNVLVRPIVTFNTALLAAGFFGILAPSTSALLHNMSTMGICAKSMMPLKQHAPAKRS